MGSPDITGAMDRHSRIALQLSGGRDSLACLELLRGYWDALTVYWVNTGDAFPEVRAVMEKVKAKVPSFVEIPGTLDEVQSTFGMATDILPVESTPLARIYNAKALPLIDRYSCCFETYNRPMHERMLADGITLVIRGQRNDDKHRGPLNSGAVSEYELLFPIEAWSENDVMDFLAGTEFNDTLRFYEYGMRGTPDCMSCGAWWDQGRSAYMKRFHPEVHQQYLGYLSALRGVMTDYMDRLDAELEA